MSVTGLMTKPARLRYRMVTGQDQYGQPVVSTRTVDTTCYFRTQATLLTDSPYLVEERLRVILSADTQTEGLSGVEIDGVQYELNGAVHVQWNPRKQAPVYVQVPVRVAGSK